MRESNFAKVRHKKGPEFQRLSSSANQSHNLDRPDIKIESDHGVQRLFEAEVNADKKMSRSNTISFGDEGMNFEDIKYVWFL